MKMYIFFHNYTNIYICLQSFNYEFELEYQINFTKTTFEVNDNQKYTVKDGVIFNADGTELVLFPPGVEEAVITSKFRRFGECAFAYSRVLTRVLFISGNEI